MGTSIASASHPTHAPAPCPPAAAGAAALTRAPLRDAGELAARRRLADVRRRILAAARRGATEVAIPADAADAVPTSAPDSDALRRCLRAQGFTVTPVLGEDGPYAVISW